MFCVICCAVSEIFLRRLDNVDIIPIDGLTAQKRLVEAGFGIALLAESGIEDELRTGALKVIDVPALEASIPITVVHRSNGYLSPAAKGLLAMIAAPGAKTPARGARQQKPPAKKASRP